MLERHPNLKIFAVHGGGYLGGYSGRIDHAWGARSDAHASLPKPPSEYLKKIYFDTVVFTPIQLEAMVKTFGADHVVLGTDLSVRYGGLRPDRARGFDGLRRRDHGGDLGRECEAGFWDFDAVMPAKAGIQ